MTRVYPCGAMVVADRLVCHAPPINEPVTGEQPWKIHPSGRSLSRMLRAGSRGTLSFVFTETWRIGTICCLGPCLLVRAIVTPFVVYPYPQQPPEGGSLFVIADRILEAGCPLTIEVECHPELFMLDGDEDAEIRPGYFDALGGVHGQ